MEYVDVAIIGAGPYGLSLAAHLRSQGVEHRIFGEPMKSWRKRMPPGMLLKSDGWSSSLFEPEGHFTLGEFCRAERIAYHDSQIPVALDTFVAYGMAFQKRYAPHVENKHLVALSGAPGRFEMRFDDGTSTAAGKVVLAVGVHPFKYLPSALAGLPSENVSHSGDHGPIDRFKNKRVVVIGSGASAIDIAALLHEQGARVTLVARAEKLKFGTRSRLNRSTFSKIMGPSSGLGGGWLLKICSDAPELIHALPGPMRVNLVNTELGPSGGWFMRERLLDHVPLSLGRDVTGACMSGGKVQLELRSRDGAPEALSADHVIAATGYRIDARRFGFLADGLLRGLRLIENAPALSRNYETSIPGLYVAGPATAYGFGPVARFVYGAIHPARRLARHFASRAPTRAAVQRPVKVA